MANTFATLAIIGSLLAALTALIALDVLLLVPAGYALIAGVYIALRAGDDRISMSGAALSGVVGLVVVVGILMGWLGFSLGAGLSIVANLGLVATVLAAHWHDLPSAGAIASAAALGIAAVLALVFHNNLTDFFAPWTFIVAALSLVGLYPAIVASRA